MLGLKVKKENAEKIRQALKQRQLIDFSYKIFEKGRFIYIPIVEERASEAEKFGELVNESFERQKRERKKSLDELLGKELENEPKAYDVLGDIAIINETKHAKELAKAIMEVNKRVKTVIMKKGAVKGAYRTRAYIHVLGKRNYAATYRENGCTFKFDVRKVFFSTRLAYERDRISRLVKDGENVMVMFAGVGPFAIEIAKRHKDAKVVAIELNTHAYKSMLENIAINKVENVIPVKGDVSKKVEKFRNWSDRVVMPLPKSARNFFDSVLVTAKNPCIVHYYFFGKQENALEKEKLKIREFFEKKGKKVRFLFSRIVRPYSPGIIELVVDFEIYENKNTA